MWTRRRSPGTFNIICYYTLDNSVRTSSPHSLPAPVTVLSQKPKLTVNYDNQSDELRFVCEIPESESVTAGFRCNLYTGENPHPFLIQTSQKRNSGKEVCDFTAQRNDVFHRLQSVKSREMSCDYSLISDLTARSLMSDKYSLIRFFPSPTQPSITTEKSTAYFFTTTIRTTSMTTTTPPPPPPPSPSTVKEKTSADLLPETTKLFITPEKSTAGLSTQPITTRYTTITMSATVTPDHHNQSLTSTANNLSITSSTGHKISLRGSLIVLLPPVVGVVLAGLMSISLCMFIRKQKVKRHNYLTSDDQGGMLSVLNMNTFNSEAAGPYTVISSVPLPSLSLDTGRDTKEDSKQKEDDVYHMYCTIADTQVVNKNKNEVYSLLQMH
ncbi:mucin-2-like isoform X3 [Silurus meridionalis]|uniref:mucin-2-like isoform X3 n=1 Tax=Silurus meridionalis TaxID=175797 RepID=UPI001EEBB527|nr:mucin-2-like isoform X3 [Silurus meridionalis]